MINAYTEKYNIKMTNLKRHDKTMQKVKTEIASLIGKYSKRYDNFLEVGAEGAWQTLFYRDQIIDCSGTTVYDWRDHRIDELKESTNFFKVDLEKEKFPEKDSSYDIIVCNQVFEHLKNIFLPISEIYRILKPGGFLIFSVPNMYALHNVLLMLLGKQPTTMNIFGSHIRGFAIHSMSEFLTFNKLFELKELKAIGLHPFTSSEQYFFLKQFSHTPVWVLEKKLSDLPNWVEARESVFTTTNF